MAKMTDTKATLEQALAIGRPAPSAAYKTCTRCKGTGWWQFARKCFKCGGKGHTEISTLATKIRDKKAHVAEVTGIIADQVARIPTLRFGVKSALDRLESDRLNLHRLERELAALLAQAQS